MKTNLFIFPIFIIIGLGYNYFQNEKEPSVNCNVFFYKNEKPRFKEKIKQKCYSNYSVFYSETRKTSIISAEHLTRNKIIEARKQKRIANFDYSNFIIRSYINSGYDRGHMAPSGDMPNIDAQKETFVWYNIIPQDHTLNADRWVKIEQNIRNLAVYYKDVYVVTGALFEENPKKIGFEKVMVPSFLWKAIYIPKTNISNVYICVNTNQQKCTTISIKKFLKQTNINVFPALLN